MCKCILWALCLLPQRDQSWSWLIIWCELMFTLGCAQFWWSRTQWCTCLARVATLLRSTQFHCRFRHSVATQSLQMRPHRSSQWPNTTAAKLKNWQHIETSTLDFLMSFISHSFIVPVCLWEWQFCSGVILLLFSLCLEFNTWMSSIELLYVECPA